MRQPRRRATTKQPNHQGDFQAKQQPADQLDHQAIRQELNKASSNQSTLKPSNKPTNQGNNPTKQQPANQLHHQAINQLLKQPTNQANKRLRKQ
jgi:hypothetical protein